MFLHTLYNLSLSTLALFYLPKFFFDRWCRGKHRSGLGARFFGYVPSVEAKGPVIWLHAVSVGEAKALLTLLPHVRESYPEAFILVSTVTETGNREVRKHAREADAIRYMPIDFPWAVRRFVRKVRPDLLLLTEGDFWYNLLTEVKKGGGKIVLVNGKLSDVSFARYLRCRSFSTPLFREIDLFCVRTEEYADRFSRLGVGKEKLFTIPNLKYDIPSPHLSCEEKERQKRGLRLEESDVVCTLGSTHPREEEALLRPIVPLLRKYPGLRVLIAPRHPERFGTVASLLKKSGVPHMTYSSRSEGVGEGEERPRLILIDEMGVLPMCYALSAISIVGGSFLRGVGGHDVFEPVKTGSFVLFGPHMEKQRDIVGHVLTSGAGKQLSLREISTVLDRCLSCPAEVVASGRKGRILANRLRGSSGSTWRRILSTFPL
ncbi:MAG: hypothetical protein OXF02_04870 [Simkaniaceae bacterium]|nr:hypothetical protein [Simkaniaceae bacterium]